MAGTLSHRPALAADRDRILDLVQATYGKRPSDDLFPEDRLVIEEDGRIVAFAALYRLDDVVVGAVDWASIEEGRTEDDMAAILGVMLDGFRELKARYDLRAVMVHTPYDAIRAHLDARDLQVGEQKIRRLVVSHAPEM